MERTACFLALSLVVFTAKGQAGTGGRASDAWFEIMVGVRTPTGLLGAAAGVEWKRLIIPSAALGFGGSEGFNWSLGNEARIGEHGIVGLRAFGYWTYAAGSRDDGDPAYPIVIGSSEALKLGGVFLVDLEDVYISARVGYSWYLREPSGDTGLSQGPLVGVGLRIPL